MPLQRPVGALALRRHAHGTLCGLPPFSGIARVPKLKPECFDFQGSKRRREVPSGMADGVTGLFEEIAFPNRC